jgi:hypothetical protein
MANEKIIVHMCGSNDFTLLKLNHTEYSLEPCGACSDAVTTHSRGSGFLSRRIACISPHESELAAHARGRSSSQP